jgi:hypothetical protein
VVISTKLTYLKYGEPLIKSIFVLAATLCWSYWRSDFIKDMMDKYKDVAKASGVASVWFYPSLLI